MSQVRYIFLSHNSVDKPDVELLAEKLEKHPLATKNNIKVWLDKNNLEHGAYTDQFAKAIKSDTACAFLLFVPADEIRGYVKHEIQIAFNRKMNDDKAHKIFPILPVYPQTVGERRPLPDPLSDHQYRENINSDDGKIEAILNDVIKAISENLKVTTSPKGEAGANLKIPTELAASQNHTLLLDHAEQWLCFDLSREDGAVTATSVDDDTKITQIPEQEVFNQFSSTDLASQLFPSAFPEKGDAPKRLRIRTNDSDLAMLPWAQLHAETVVEVSSVSTHYRPDFNKLNITTPLVVIPEEPQKLKPSTHYRLLHEYFNGYLNIRGPIPRVTNRKSLKRELEHQKPDFLYFYGSIKRGKIILDASNTPSPDEDTNLTLEELGEWIKDAKLRPVVVISLIGEELKHYPRVLAENCRVLWVQSTASKISSKSKDLEDILANTLERLGQESDLVTLINESFSKDRTIKQHLWVYGQSPEIDTKNLQLIHRLRAALLRVMLGREDLKGKLYSEIQKPEHLSTRNCLAYVVTGDNAACPFDVPAQLQQRLDKDDAENSLQLINFPLSLTVDIDADPEDAFAELFEGSLLDRSGHIEETFHNELMRRGLLEVNCGIAINWSINLPENASVVLADWLTAWANLIRDEITPYVPERTLLINALCIQTANPEMAQQLQDTANKTLQKYRREGVRLIRISEALGKLQDYEIIDFFEDNPHWQETLKFDTYTIDPDEYTDWVYQRSNQGEFEETVKLIWQQYQNDYNDYKAQ